MEKYDEKQGEKVEVLNIGQGLNPPQMGNTLNSEGEKQALQEFSTKKKVYKYNTIKLLLDEEREKLLKDCCEVIGLDKTRVDDHQQDVVWEILRWTLPALRIRRYLLEIVGPVINCTPEREQTKELNSKKEKTR